jgi:hypothetical protein
MAATNLFHVQKSTVRSNGEMLALQSQDLGDECIVETRDSADNVTGQKNYKLIALPSSLISNWQQVGGDGYSPGSGGGGSASWPVPGTPATFPPEAHRHVWGDLDSIPGLLTAVAALSGNGVIEKTGAATVATITTSIFGKTLLGMADAAALRATLGVSSSAESLLKANNLSDLTNVTAARTALGLGTAAVLNTTGVGSVVQRGADLKIPLSDLPALVFGSTYDASSQAEMLALSAVKGDVCRRLDTNETYYLSATPASTLANWKLVLVPLTSSITTVFGQSGPDVTISGLATLVGAIDDADQLIVFDQSSGTHRRVTRANFLNGIGAVLAVAGDGAKGIAVSTASGTATVGLKTDGLPSLVADFGSSSANFLVAKADGTPGQITANALFPALPARATPADTDIVATSTAAGALGKTTLAELLTGRTITRPRLVDQTEAKQVRVDVSGSYTLPTGVNTHHIRLTNNATVTLADVRPAAAGTWRGQTLIVDQDGTGGRTLTLQAPAGQTLEWTGGSPPALNSATNGRTRYVFTYDGGEARIDGIKSF